jgi:hypothetical protein
MGEATGSLQFDCLLASTRPEQAYVRGLRISRPPMGGSAGQRPRGGVDGSEAGPVHGGLRPGSPR